MKAPSQADHFVAVQAYLSDEDFGYDNWHARQFASKGNRPAVLILCRDKAEQQAALEFLRDRAVGVADGRR